jgi:hypothetical protein
MGDSTTDFDRLRFVNVLHSAPIVQPCAHQPYTISRSFCRYHLLLALRTSATCESFKRSRTQTVDGAKALEVIEGS